MTEQEKIDAVCKATGFHENVCEEELQREGWNVDMAIFAIREKQNGGGT